MAGYRINAGRMDRLITIQYQVVSRTSTGAENVTWATWVENMPAELVRPFLNPKEGIRDDYVLMSEQYTNWVIRYCQMTPPKPRFPTSKMRLFDQSVPEKVYDVENVEEVGRGDGWWLRTKLVNP